MNLPHDLIEYIYTFLNPKPCRSSFIILDRESHGRYQSRTSSCRFVYFYGLEWCEKHKYVRPVRTPECLIS